MSLVFAVETVAACWEEILPLAQAHHEGAKGYRRSQPFAPSRARYHAYNESGMFRLCTARDAGRLVGYFTFYVTHSMHSQWLMAVEDTFYLHPDVRQGRNAIRFMRYIEDQCRQQGVQELLFSCEVGNPMGKILVYLDYQPVIVQHSKYLQPTETEVPYVCAESTARA